MGFKSAFKNEYEYIHQRIQKVAPRFDEDLAFVCPAPDMNHAAWLLGHITWCEDFLIADVPYGKSYRNKEWDRMFEFFSKKLDHHMYPSYTEICVHYESVHVQVSRHLEDLTEESLSILVPYNDAHYNRMSFLLHFIEEGSTHVGQLQYLFKILRSQTEGI